MLETQPLPVQDLQVPDPIGWWPPAPGWWLLLMLALVAIAAAIRYHRKSPRSPDPRLLRSAALDELDSYYQRYQISLMQDAPNTGNATGPLTAQFIQQISALLKRVALLSHDPKLVAGLSGECWADFLTRGQEEGCRVQIRMLLNQSYRAQPEDIDIDPLYHFARRWITSKEAFAE